MTKYASIITKLIKKADKVNKESIEATSKLMAECIKNNGIIYMFGCGHSGLIAQDCFYRAGGLANVQPILIPELMLHVSASNSSTLEKDESNARKIFDEYSPTKDDMLFVFSVSGINGVPVEVAKVGKDRGLKVICMGSSDYNDEKTRHSSKKRWSDYCDVFIDNCVPKGDSVLEIDSNSKAVPVSTAICSFLIQSCIYKTLLICKEKGISVDYFGSGNLAENKKKNSELVLKYKERIKHL